MLVWLCTTLYAPGSASLLDSVMSVCVHERRRYRPRLRILSPFSSCLIPHPIGYDERPFHAHHDRRREERDGERKRAKSSSSSATLLHTNTHVITIIIIISADMVSLSLHTSFRVCVSHQVTRSDQDTYTNTRTWGKELDALLFSLSSPLLLISHSSRHTFNCTHAHLKKRERERETDL